jgi:glutamate-5-semialdehyde dehydrogenase
MSAAFDPATSKLHEECQQLAQRAKSASWQAGLISSATKDRWLNLLADTILSKTPAILEANQKDLQQESAQYLTAALRERLRFDEKRIAEAAQGIRQVAALPDPVQQIISGQTRPNGLQIRKIRVPLGVIFFLYESRPNVTLDAAALCVKSGNAVILRGGKEAQHTNRVLGELIRESLKSCGISEEIVQLVQTTDRQAVDILLKMPEQIDLVIPRGGEGLIRKVTETTRIPVLKHFLGNCHVYVHESADLEMAERIVVNAKCQRPSVCNAMESLLVDRAIAPDFLPRIDKALTERGVELRACEVSQTYLKKSLLADESDFAAEFCDLILSIKTVCSFDEAISHINRYGSHHTDAIVTSELKAAQRFQREIDSAAVVVNASTRFNDGFELGLGAEIGISTDKLHARGPCGLEELTSYKYLVIGEGHVRE